MLQTYNQVNAFRLSDELGHLRSIVEIHFFGLKIYKSTYSRDNRQNLIAQLASSEDKAHAGKHIPNSGTDPLSSNEAGKVL